MNPDLGFRSLSECEGLSFSCRALHDDHEHE